MTLTTTLSDQLDVQNISLGRFQEIVTRLFASGIVVREEEGTEQRVYDDARRIEYVLAEFFALAGFRLVHEVNNSFFRLYAPGTQIPGMADDELDPVPSLRAKLSPDFVAAALALRFQYQQGLMDGGARLTPEGEVLIRFEELAVTLQTTLKRPLPESAGERERLIKELRKYRLIQVGPGFSITSEDALIAIRPTILGIISEEALAAAIDPGTPQDTPQLSVEEEA